MACLYHGHELLQERQLSSVFVQDFKNATQTKWPLLGNYYIITNLSYLKSLHEYFVQLTRFKFNFVSYKERNFIII